MRLSSKVVLLIAVSLGSALCFGQDVPKKAEQKKPSEKSSSNRSTEIIRMRRVEQMRVPSGLLKPPSGKVFLWVVVKFARAVPFGAGVKAVDEKGVEYSLNGVGIDKHNPESSFAGGQGFTAAAGATLTLNFLVDAATKIVRLRGLDKQPLEVQEAAPQKK